LESGQLERAVSAQESATKIGEKELGAESLEFATFLHNLGTAYGAADSPEKALPVLERALMIREELSGPNSRPVAETLLSIAQLHRRNGEFERALPLVERVVEIYGEAPDSWMLADLLMINAQYRQLLGAPTSDVRALMARSVDIRSRGMTRQLTLGSEEENILYVGSVGAGQINGVLSFQTEESGGDPDSTRLALTTLLQWKGRVLDSSAGSLMRLRRRLEPEDQTLLVELTQVREELSELATSGALMTKARIKEAEKLAARARDLEATLAERSAEFRLRTRPVALDEIQKRLPENAALVEIARFRPVVFEAKSRDDWYGAPRYVAYVLRQSGEPSWVALGGGAEIDRLAASFRAAVGGPGLEEFGTQARALYDAIFKPLLPLIGDAEHLLLSPDGALHLVPFGALLDEDDHFLIEDYLLSYLDSGRDLARLKLSAKAREGAWIVAAPDFDAGAVPEDAATTVVQADTPLRSGDYRDMFFEPLAGTNDEAKAIHALLPNASIRLDDEATEELLKARHGPSILHIATHGFFLDDQDLSADKSPARGLTLSAPFGGETDFSSEPIVENPLLRSGVALAGANRRSTRGEDGVLTALEASGLDLDGTRLVVLSACDTGLGDLRNSEGVFGLRRAFVLAGAESQVMSLWRVDDEATRNLMVDFYTCLAAGQGRAEALRRAQIQMLRDEERSHPFYWAAFIQSGAWRPLKGITKR
jgi:CHAT domain-containing protein